MAQRIQARREMGSIQTLIDRYGPEHYDKKRNVYRVPGQYKSEFDEMARPHRRLETARGLELQADQPRKVRLRHPDGSFRECSEQNARGVARMVGAVEAPVYRGRPIVPLEDVYGAFSGLAQDERGYLYRVEGGLVTPTGHMHLLGSEPLPWVRTRCAGCQAEAGVGTGGST